MKTLFGFILLLFFVSCGDPCDEKTCNDRGSCSEGICICEEFYEGDDCELEIRERYIGSWVADYTCGSTGTGLMFEITPGVELSSIRVTSSQIFSSAIFVGSLEEDNSILIPRTQGGGLNLYTGDIEYLGPGRIRMTLIHEASGDVCTFSMERV